MPTVTFGKKKSLIADILKIEVQSFINQHENDDVNKLILKTPNIHGVSMARIAEQIIGRRKAKEKLPSFYQAKEIVYPPALNLEQSSSEKAGRFKSEVAIACIEEKFECADLTGGFGVDSYFFSRAFKNLHYVDPNNEVLEIAHHNHRLLGATNIQYHNTSAEAYLNSVGCSFDCIFIDPSRRNEFNRKTTSFNDCDPRLPELLPTIFLHSRFLLIKASPLHDIKKAITELKKVRHVFVVSVDNECKELLFLCDRSFVGEPLIEAVNLFKDRYDSFAFRFSEENSYDIMCSDPETFIYEPNASVLKAGAFKSIAARMDVTKVHPNTHLYTSKRLVENFPGKTFRLNAVIKADAKHIKEHFSDGYANIMTRNYPHSPAELKSKTRLTDGGQKFLIGFRGLKKMYLISAERIG